MKIYSENGLLNDKGKIVLGMFLEHEIENLMNSEESVQELLVLKAVLTKYVGDKISERITKLESEK